MLKKKRFQEQLLDKTENQISNLERMVNKLNNCMKVDKKTPADTDMPCKHSFTTTKFASWSILCLAKILYRNNEHNSQPVHMLNVYTAMCF